MKAAIRLSTLIVALFGCGQHSKSVPGGGGSPPPQSAPKPSPKQQSFSLDEHWRVTSMDCDKSSLPIPLGLEYRLDDDHLVRIQDISNDGHQLCRMAAVYNRTITNFFDYDGQYNEKALLAAARAKKTCWQLENGAPVDPSTDTPVDFEPEQGDLALLYSGDVIVLNFHNLKNCPGNLTVGAEKAKIAAFAHLDGS